MTRPLIISLLITFAAASAGCATASSQTASAGDAEEECRYVVRGDVDAGELACMSAAEWEEFDRTNDVTMHEDVTCRQMLLPVSNTLKVYCATEEEWAEYERRQRASTLSLLEALVGG